MRNNYYQCMAAKVGTLFGTPARSPYMVALCVTRLVIVGGGGW